MSATWRGGWAAAASRWGSAACDRCNGAAEVEVDHSTPFINRRMDCCGRGDHARVVDHDVEASERLGGGSNALFSSSGVGGVCFP